jgi:hypothetical protein
MFDFSRYALEVHVIGYCWWKNLGQAIENNNYNISFIAYKSMTSLLHREPASVTR